MFPLPFCGCDIHFDDDQPSNLRSDKCMQELYARRRGKRPDCQYSCNKKCECNMHFIDCAYHRDAACSCWHNSECPFRFDPEQKVQICNCRKDNLGKNFEPKKECDPGCKHKKLYGSTQNCIEVQNTLYQQFDTLEQFQLLLENGLENKHMGKSGVNNTSSRSHSIFEIRIKTSSNEIDRIPLNKYGKISVVDLAGFEHQDCRGSEVFNQKMNILH